MVVLTKDEFLECTRKNGVKKASQDVDVVTTATFGPMCSSGVFLNFGHTDPPIKMQKIWLNDVPAYGGIAAADAYLGATEISETEGIAYGGAHVIEDLLRGKRIRIYAQSHGTDCYPLKEFEGIFTLRTLNQAMMFNPRNVYQNYSAATNSRKTTIYTYMGTLLSNYSNVNYATCGYLSPLNNDPEYLTIGTGTRVFLGGGTGYVVGPGTQHNPGQKRDNKTKTTIGPGATLCLSGDLKGMSPDYVRAAVFYRYGVTLFLGIGIPIPVLNEQIANSLLIADKDIYTTIVDYGISEGKRPVLKQVSYAELRSGEVELKGHKVPSAPLCSLYKAREITKVLKQWIKNGKFLLGEPAATLPINTTLHGFGKE